MDQHQLGKQIVVIGAGLHGLCTAYYLAQAGHQVVILDRHRHVAEGVTLGNSGVSHPSACLPWARSTLRRELVSGAFQQQSAALFNGRSLAGTLPWLKQWIETGKNTAQLEQAKRLLHLGQYNRYLLDALTTEFNIDIEQSAGLLHLFRDKASFDVFAPHLAAMQELEIAHEVLDPTQARERNTALSGDTPLYAAVSFSDVSAGNATLFTKLLKTLLQEAGVQFYFDTEVLMLQPTVRGARVELELSSGEHPVADAVVLATGPEDGGLLHRLKIKLPIQIVKTITATATMRDYEHTPGGSLFDDTFKTSVAVIGRRIKVAGTVEFGARSGEPDPKALRTILKVAQDWFPLAANYHNARFWSGMVPFHTSETPAFGPTSIPNVFLNLGHGTTGWSSALASAHIVADQISMRPAEIDLTGLLTHH